MTTFSNAWVQEMENKIMKTLRNAPHPKGTGANPPKVERDKMFPKFKPGTGGFDMTKKGPGSNKATPDS